VKQVIPAIRTVLINGGFAKKENNVEQGGQMLVGFRGCLFQIESDFQVGWNACGYDAVGAGAEIALGSLATTAITGSTTAPSDRLKIALLAAEEHNIGVRQPFTILRLGGTEEPEDPADLRRIPRMPGAQSDKPNPA
jgi:hypothetical protein